MLNNYILNLLPMIAARSNCNVCIRCMHVNCACKCHMCVPIPLTLRSYLHSCSYPVAGDGAVPARSQCVYVYIYALLPLTLIYAYTLCIYTYIYTPLNPLYAYTSICIYSMYIHV